LAVVVAIAITDNETAPIALFHIFCITHSCCNSCLRRAQPAFSSAMNTRQEQVVRAGEKVHRKTKNIFVHAGEPFDD
jgi:hypothetical protein